MQNFFVSLTPEQHARAQASGLPALDFQLGDLQGVIYDPLRFACLLEVLDLEVASSSNTDVEGLQRVELRPANGAAIPHAATPQSQPEPSATRLNEAQRVARQQYIEACTSRFGPHIQALEASVQKQRDTIHTLRQQLVTAQRAADDARRRLDHLRTGQGEGAERFGHEFDRMLAHPNIKDVRLAGEKLQIFTTVLYCQDPRTRALHEIGQFRIEIPTNGAGGVRWFNLTHPVTISEGQTWQAPHIGADGRACEGNTAESFASLIADREFANAAYLAIQFVESVNVHDAWGRHIDRWPVARRNA